VLAIEGVYHDVEPYWSVEKGHGLNTLVYVMEGKVIYNINNKTIALEKGEILYIPSKIERSWMNHPEGPHKKYTVIFSWEKNSVELPPFFNNTEDIFRYKPRNTAFYEQRLSFLNIQWLGQRSLYEQLSDTIMSELIYLISQERIEWHTSPIKERTARTIQEFILNNYRRNITIEELAEVGEVTPNYVTVLFKEVIGITPIQYLHQTRINTAWSLLNNTDMSVREVAEYLGYCDQAYFNRVFKKWMGTAPTHVKT
jgi:AraC-like DNA-binding protein